MATRSIVVHDCSSLGQDVRPQSVREIILTCEANGLIHVPALFFGEAPQPFFMSRGYFETVGVTARKQEIHPMPSGLVARPGCL